VHVELRGLSYYRLPAFLSRNIYAFIAVENALLDEVYGEYRLPASGLSGHRDQEALWYTPLRSAHLSPQPQSSAS